MNYFVWKKHHFGAFLLSVINTIIDLSFRRSAEHLSSSSNKRFHRSNTVNIDWKISCLSACRLVDWVFNSQIWRFREINSQSICINQFNLFKFFNFWPCFYEVIDSVLNWIRFRFSLLLCLCRCLNWCCWIRIFCETVQYSTYENKCKNDESSLFIKWLFCFFFWHCERLMI